MRETLGAPTERVFGRAVNRLIFIWEEVSPFETAKAARVRAASLLKIPDSRIYIEDTVGEV